MQKITTFLTFNDQAEEAARFYTAIFKDASIGNTMRGPDGGVLVERLSDPDPVKAKRAMDAMLEMRKIDIAAIERATEEA